MDLFIYSRQRLQSVLNKLKKHGFLPMNFPHMRSCVSKCAGGYSIILNNKFHVLHQLLPPEREMPYSLRPRAHNRTIPIAHNSAFKKNFNNYYIIIYYAIYNYFIIINLESLHVVGAKGGSLIMVLLLR